MQVFTILDKNIYQLKTQNLKVLKKTGPEKSRAFQLIQSQIKSIFKEDGKNVVVQKYGSMANGLAIDSSDMDILISGLYFQSRDRGELIEKMRKLNAHFQSSLYCLESNNLIETASVPVIKLVSL